MSRTYSNPIIPGFFPDPTICRVGEDYYLATSSFELFPALPVFHSKDLVHWKQLGCAQDRPEQVHVSSNLFSGGMMAPTLRYHNGTFYMICCNFAEKGNFLITAQDPAGPWSMPLFLEEVDGIDATIFFDDDGKCYVAGTGDLEFPDGTDRGIWAAQMDPATGKLLTEKKTLWRSALRSATSPEAPHIYHIGTWYYLLTAECGTEHYHSVVFGRCKEVLGTYEACPNNPVLAHRHLGKLYPIGNPGHADLVQTQNGEWYAVFLASRLVDGFHKNMGRETYMVPVIWEDEWPVFSPGTGKVEWTYPAPNLPEDEPVEPLPETDDFDSEKLAMCWCFWGTPYTDFWKLEESALKLQALPRPMARPLRSVISDSQIRKDDNAAVIFRRQCQPNFDAAAKIRFAAGEGESAGILMLQQLNHQLRVEKRAGEIRVIRAEAKTNGPVYLPDFKDETAEFVIASIPYEREEAVLRINATGQDISVFCNDEQICHVDGRLINPESLGPMTGTMVGMFACTEKEEAGSWAAFDWFRYREF
ncbi:MAG: glycoside hydrolase family 43 protein [Firmicutes bacterium]|nr:glycoside hydrolase family 43 protein [Bacillota bacterium]